MADEVIILNGAQPSFFFQIVYIFKFQGTGLCRGFAYVHFKFRADAARAIQILNGHGYDHLILNAEWSKPPQNN